MRVLVGDVRLFFEVRGQEWELDEAGHAVLLDAVGNALLRLLLDRAQAGSVTEQLDDALEAARQGRIVELFIQTTNWYQNLLARPEEMVTFCQRLVSQALLNERAASERLLSST